MNIKKAKEDIKNTVRAYLKKDVYKRQHYNNLNNNSLQPKTAPHARRYLLTWGVSINLACCKLLFHLQSYRTVVRTHDRLIYNGIFYLFFPSFGYYQVLNPPSRIFFSCFEAIRPPCISSCKFWVKITETINTVSYTHLDVYKRQSEFVTLSEIPISTYTLYVVSEYLPPNPFILRF